MLCNEIGGYWRERRVEKTQACGDLKANVTVCIWAKVGSVRASHTRGKRAVEPSDCWIQLFLHVLRTFQPVLKCPVWGRGECKTGASLIRSEWRMMLDRNLVV